MLLTRIILAHAANMEAVPHFRRKQGKRRSELDVTIPTASTTGISPTGSRSTRAGPHREGSLACSEDSSNKPCSCRWVSPTGSQTRGYKQKCAYIRVDRVDHGHIVHMGARHHIVVIDNVVVQKDHEVNGIDVGEILWSQTQRIAKREC